MLAPILRSNRRSALILGPRQVGKSTLLSSLGPDIAVNLASPSAFRAYVSHPERLERELHVAPPGAKTVFIDEAQRVPALLDVVQLFLDEHPGRFRFQLSGSSARKLRRGGFSRLLDLVASTAGPAAAGRSGDCRWSTS